MQNAPVPENDDARVGALREFLCSYTPREERFDRITRTTRKLLNVPICMISIVEKDEQWFRSIQGLTMSYTSRDVSFCGHAILADQPLVVRDTLRDNRFADNPLVTGAPRIRSYAGIALEIAPGLKAGTLCVIDTMPRDFGAEDLEGLRDLASMAEAELRMSAIADLQQSILINKEAPARRAMLDPATGCWNGVGHQALLERIDDAGSASQVALMAMVVVDFAGLKSSYAELTEDIMAGLAQQIRRRLPAQALLTRPSDDVFSVILPCEPGGSNAAAITALQAEVQYEVEFLAYEELLHVQVQMLSSVDWVRKQGAAAPAANITWETVLAQLTHAK